MIRREAHLRHEFVEYIPDHLTEGTIYLSIAFATAAHKCCCGCGNIVITPFSPTDWKLTFDGESISLDPSIGNWSFPCKSHYWISRNRVRWASQWSQKQIDAGRVRDRLSKEKYFGVNRDQSVDGDPNTAAGQSEENSSEDGGGHSKNWWA